MFGCFSFVLDGYVVSRIIEFKMKEMWQALVPAITCTMGMIVVVSAAKLILPSSRIVQLVSVILLGASTFIILLYFVDRQLVSQVFGTIKKMRVRQ